MTTLWRHAPMLSAPPKELLEHNKANSGNEVYEKAVFLLENGKYLYIRYFGMIDNENTGVTDVEEFDSFEEAKEVFNEH